MKYIKKSHKIIIYIRLLKSAKLKAVSTASIKIENIFVEYIRILTIMVNIQKNYLFVEFYLNNLYFKYIQ